MNAGAYKSDMGYVVSKIRVLTPKMNVITMVNRELDFHYRTSFLKKNKNYICLEATFQLSKGNKELLEEVIKDRKERDKLAKLKKEFALKKKKPKKKPNEKEKQSAIEFLKMLKNGKE